MVLFSLGLLALLVVAMGVIDLRARRRGHRYRGLDEDAAANGRRLHAARFPSHGNPPDRRGPNAF